MQLLVVTSFLFFTNFLHNTWHRQYIYAWLFLLLTTTSLFVHSQLFKDFLHLHNQILFLDKSIILSIFTYGLYLYWKSSVSFYPVLSFITVVLIYSQIYHLQQEYVIVTHGLMHLIGSLGHHSIIYNYGNYMDTNNKLRDIIYAKHGIESISTNSTFGLDLYRNCLK